MNKKYSPFILLLVLATILFLVKKSGCNRSKTATNTETVKDHKGLNRNPSQINYSKHAECRMDCRHIDATEVKDILQNGKINYKKSELDGEECRKKYAVEGYSKDNQHLRIVFAPCASEITVVTCIDLDTHWECHCEGDDNKD